MKPVHIGYLSKDTEAELKLAVAIVLAVKSKDIPSIKRTPSGITESNKFHHYFNDRRHSITDDIRSYKLDKFFTYRALTKDDLKSIQQAMGMDLTLDSINYAYWNLDGIPMFEVIPST